MEARQDIPESPDPSLWAVLFLRPLRWLGWTALGLLVVFAILEFVAWRVYPAYTARFLVAGNAGGQPAWIDNQLFAYRFFSGRLAQAPLPVVARKQPPPGTLRVCLLGGSQVVGSPDPGFGLGPQLELLLRRRYPGQPVEVLTLALEGGNSHVLREAARDLARLRPQAVIILAGNEEVSGPYGPASGFGRFHQSSRIARVMALFSRTRLSRLIVGGVNRLFPSRTDLNAWRSGEPITLRGRMAPGDPRLKTVARSFHKNLLAILRTAARASPAVVVCTVPVNLRDCAPFSTSYLEDETAAQEVRELLRAARAAEAATNRMDAARLYSDIIRRDPTHAEALFRAARLALGDNRTAEAAALFARARDADALRLRADSGINAAIRTCAVEASVSLLDAEALFAIRSPQGIPGREWFLDHIHFTFEGTHLLATALLDRLEFLGAFGSEPAGDLPEPGVLAAEMLFHPWGRIVQLRALIAQLLRPPFRRQLDNSETIERLKAEKKLWEERAAATPRGNVCANIAKKQAEHPDDPWLAARAAQYLLEANAPALAEKAARAAHDRWPHRYEIRARLALVRALQNEPAEAGLAFLRGADPDTGYWDVVQALAVGRELLVQRQPAKARPWFEYALGRDPWNSDAAIALADTLHRLEDGDAAVKILQAAIKRNPGNPLLWEELASLYCLLGNWETANECFLKSEEIAPYRYERLLKWAEALVRLKQYARARRPIQQYLSILPEDPEALALNALIYRHLPPRPPDEPAARAARNSTEAVNRKGAPVFSINAFPLPSPRHTPDR